MQLANPSGGPIRAIGEIGPIGEPFGPGEDERETTPSFSSRCLLPILFAYMGAKIAYRIKRTTSGMKKTTNIHS